MYDLHLPHLQKPKDKFSYNRKNKQKKHRWNILRGNQATINQPSPFSGRNPSPLYTASELEALQS